MTDIKWEGPTQAYINDGTLGSLTTTLNSLAINTTDLAATAINNETNLCTFMDLELTLASLDLSGQTAPNVTIYLIESIDGGTDFDTASDAVSADASIPPADKIIAIIGLRPGTGAEAKTAVKSMIPIPPGRFKLMVRNTTGVQFAASGNILAYRTYNIQSV
jgi:hypothetical protein